MDFPNGGLAIFPIFEVRIQQDGIIGVFEGKANCRFTVLGNLYFTKFFEVFSYEVQPCFIFINNQNLRLTTDF